MKRLSLGVAMLLLLPLCALTAQAAPKSAPAPAPASNVEPMPAANWLFVQTGNGFQSDGKTLTLKGVGEQTLMFTDRPERMTGDVSTAKFVSYWGSGKDDFEKDPPNATVSTVVNGKTDLAVVELRNPRLSGGNLTYDIRTLGGTLPDVGEHASVFIDWWYGPAMYGPRPWGWGGGPRAYPGGRCWRGPYGHLHCQPWWGY